MPRVFNYHRSHAHRVACLSLYRALLRGVNNFSRAILAEGHAAPTEPLTQLVRYRFRRDRKSGQSHGAVVDALNQGRNTLSLLRDAAALSPTAISTIISALTTTSAEAEISAAWREQARLRAGPRPRISINEARHIKETSTKRLVVAPSRHDDPRRQTRLDQHPLALLDLPLHNGVPRRKVPSLMTTSNGQVPVLLYKTRQGHPPWLRRIHSQQVKQTFANLYLAEEMEYLTALGKQEDSWDGYVQQQAWEENHPVDDKPRTPGGFGWSDCAHEARSAAFQVHHAAQRARAVQGWEMFQIVKQEKWLEEKESLPFKIASAIQNGQRLQERILALQSSMRVPSPQDRSAMTQLSILGRRLRDLGRTKRTHAFTPRPKETSKALIRESLSLAPLVIPTEWSKRVVDKQRPAYLPQNTAVVPEQENTRVYSSRLRAAKHPQQAEQPTTRFTPRTEQPRQANPPATNHSLMAEQPHRSQEPTATTRMISRANMKGKQLRTSTLKARLLAARNQSPSGDGSSRRSQW